MKKNDLDNENKFLQAFAGAIIGFVVLCLVSAFCVCIGGCKSAPAFTTELGERNQFVLGQLDSTITSLNRELNQSNDEIRECLERSRDIEDGARRIKYLFGEYVKTVQRIQDANNRAVERLKVLEENLHNPNSNKSAGKNSGNNPSEVRN